MSVFAENAHFFQACKPLLFLHNHWPMGFIRRRKICVNSDSDRMFPTAQSAAGKQNQSSINSDKYKSTRVNLIYEQT